jgi:DNA processing protein
LEQAERFALLAAGAGMTVVSGLARGIDAAAHRGALRAGGRTLAVLGNGLASIYPPEHASLADEISQKGALLSELPLHTRPDIGTFPVRNRIIAGLTLGTMVVEGNITSGSLITARLATDYNREVFAIPGRIDNARALGPNTLIKRGEAAMVLDWPDVLDGLGETGAVLRGKGPVLQRSPGQPPEQQALPLVALSAQEQKVYDFLAGGEAGTDEVLEKTGLAVPDTMSALTMLQIKGLVRQKPGPVFERRN